MAEEGLALLATQKNEIYELMKAPPVKGETWYLLDCRWFKQWKKFVGYDEWDSSMLGDPSANPGPVDNSFLLKEDLLILKDNLTEESDYSLLSEDAWTKLVLWYNLAEDQEPIKRKVIEQGVFMKRTQVEVYLLELKLCCNNDIEKVITKYFSHAETIESLAVMMRRLFNISNDKDVRLWYKYASNTYEMLNKWESTLQDASLYSGQVIVIEPQNDDGTWSRHTKVLSNATTSTYGNKVTTSVGAVDTNIMNSSSASFSQSSSHGHSSYSSSFYGYDSYKNNLGPGLCGLSNLGNTCFMNSAIQCMSNVSSLTEYMLEDRCKEELNVDNPLGMRGEIATTYAELVKNMWSGRYSYTVPRNFKVAVGRFKPEFSGYQQQDSQELMAFLLDGLHEDLNRIKKKPYVEMKEANNRPDAEVAKEAWADYIKRNNSVIVDTFHGLLKSTLVCPECRKVSVKFDPFCYLSLPLPVKKERQIEVILVPFDPMSKLCQYKVTVPKLGVVSHLCSALSALTNIAAEKMVVVDVYNRRFHRVFSTDDSIASILDRDDIFVYEVPVNYNENSDMLLIPVYMREDRATSGLSYPSAFHLFGLPTLVAVPQNSCTYDFLYNCVLDRMARYVRVSEITNGWWKPSYKPAEDKEGNEEIEMNNDEDSDTTTDNHDSKSGSESESLDKDDEDISDFEQRDKMPRLFTFHAVNSCGNAEVNTLNDDGKPIKFSNHPYLVAHWHPKAKSLFYDEKRAEDLDVNESVNAKGVQKKQDIQLTDCLDLFTTKERLGEHDLWFCPSCKRHQQATKKFDIWQLPRILVIHLKRFSYTRYWRDKLDTFVKYPTRGLNMNRWIINPEHVPAVYDLIAVSNHYGGMGGGHYTAFAKNKCDGQWYNFDDSSVSSSTEDAVVTQAGYVLVYEMRSDASKNPSPVITSLAPSAVSNQDIPFTTKENSSFDDDDMMETN